MENFPITVDKQFTTRKLSCLDQKKEQERFCNILENDPLSHDIENKSINPITELAALVCDTHLSFGTWACSKNVDFLSKDGCK